MCKISWYSQTESRRITETRSIYPLEEITVCSEFYGNPALSLRDRSLHQIGGVREHVLLKCTNVHLCVWWMISVWLLGSACVCVEVVLCNWHFFKHPCGVTVHVNMQPSGSAHMCDEEELSPSLKTTVWWFMCVLLVENIIRAWRRSCGWMWQYFQMLQYSEWGRALDMFWEQSQCYLQTVSWQHDWIFIIFCLPL